MFLSEEHFRSKLFEWDKNFKLGIKPFPIYTFQVISLSTNSVYNSEIIPD